MRYNNHIELQKTEFEFKEFVMLNLIYPEIEGLNGLNEEMLIEVDIEFEIDSNNVPKSILKAKHFNGIPRMVSFKKELLKIQYDLFFEECIRIIDAFKNWKQHKNDNQYKNIKFYKTIYFAYHSEYFSNKKSFVINPDIKPYFKVKNEKYERIINCKFGCDGVANLLCIVEKNGELSNIEIIGVSGKISSDFAIKELKSLGNLEPASKNGKKIRTQIDLLIYI
ncbi:hypothetical protein FPF71_10790 [Algibacter amylolyticus]|uniref:TonB C-terminal domain-containing protein n=1 Tax=Algibacter amylolyticus TaxID=1608400 RepID=A0A5M7B3C9_9FLAO|nr:hypothetical protein [Algibacter amylolyticus]KAA5824093.1 hypothetical protein F2B50_10790 [Algibacter amylolyticus]MBB5269650.1 hypothetical protein [Algibacter amylolyticus]TSJ74570.1 hypothetical protein FPF71_10790 [Algibacter amylolyticus]